MNKVTFKVGTRYECTITLPMTAAGMVGIATCEWSPCVPRSLTESEMQDYRLGMELAIDTITRSTGRLPILGELS